MRRAAAGPPAGPGIWKYLQDAEGDVAALQTIHGVTVSPAQQLLGRGRGEVELKIRILLRREFRLTCE